jgi:hypothetical protein
MYVALIRVDGPFKLCPPPPKKKKNKPSESEIRLAKRLHLIQQVGNIV